MAVAETESLSLAKALSVKNRLVGRLAQARQNVETYNSILEGQGGADAVDVRSEFERYRSLQEALIGLKTLLQHANAPIAEDIFRLGELKDRLQLLSGLNTKNGPEPGFNGVTYQYVCVFSKSETLELVKALEVEVDSIQDKLNAYNAVTRVEVPAAILALAR